MFAHLKRALGPWYRHVVRVLYVFMVQAHSHAGLYFMGGLIHDYGVLGIRLYSRRHPVSVNEVPNLGRLIYLLNGSASR